MYTSVAFKFLDHLQLFVKLHKWQTAKLFQVLREIRLELEQMPLVTFHVVFCRFICREVDVEAIFLLLEEESLLSSHSITACVD